MLHAIRGDIRDLISREFTRLRTDYTPPEVELYAKSLIVALTGTWEYSRLTQRTHLYHDVHWDQLGVEQYREALNEVFDIELPRVRFFCARTVADVRDQVVRILIREGRAGRVSPPAA